MFSKWSKNNYKTNFSEDSTKLTLAIISEAGFGQQFNLFEEHEEGKVGEEYKKLGFTQSFQEVMEHVTRDLYVRLILPKIGFTILPYLGFDKIRRIGNSFKEFRKYANLFIETRRSELEADSSANRKDLLSLLLADNSLSNKELIADVYMFLLAGHETTANTVTFALQVLATRPDIQQKVYEESCAVLDGVDSDDYYSKYRDLKYARAVFEETLRVYPAVISIPKWTTTDVEIGGFNVPAQVI